LPAVLGKTARKIFRRQTLGHIRSDDRPFPGPGGGRLPPCVSLNTRWCCCRLLRRASGCPGRCQDGSGNGAFEDVSPANFGCCHVASFLGTLWPTFPIWSERETDAGAESALLYRCVPPSSIALDSRKSAGRSAYCTVSTAPGKLRPDVIALLDLPKRFGLNCWS
jgi:hypothetical protein